METETSVEFALRAGRDGRAWVVAPSGELDLSNAGEARTALAGRPEDCDVLVLDLSGLTFVDTSGMRLAVETLQEAAIAGVRFALVRGSGEVQRLFALTRLETRLPFFDDLRAAVDDR